MLKLIAIISTIAGIATLGMTIDSTSMTRRNELPERVQPDRIFATGRIEGLSPEIELRPQLAGRVIELPVREGQHVSAGTVLLRLEDSPYREQLAIAKADLNRAEAELKRLVDGARDEERQEAAANYRARLEEVERMTLKWDRVNKLRASQAITQQEADDQISLLRSARLLADAAKARWQFFTAPAREDEVQITQARIAAAQAQVELAARQVDKTCVYAPRDGEVLQLRREIGELAGPEMPAPAIVFADTSQFQVRAFVEEFDAARVEIGMTATIVADGLKGVKLTGRVVRLSPRMGFKQLHSQQAQERLDTKVREIWISLDQAKDLVVGLPVVINIDPFSVTRKLSQN
jgi:multidrug resistance efflux pump